MPDKRKLICFSSWKCFVHVLDVFWMTFILLFQGTVMNFYIIYHYNASTTPYFLFVADFFCLCTFIGTLATSYSYLRKVSAQDSSSILRPKTRNVSRFGLFPLSYVSWLFYVSILVSKIVIIFSTEPLLDALDPAHHFGPQLLQVTMGLSAIVFLLLLEGHNWVKRGTPRYSYITSVCAKTGIELFDSVSLLAILLNDHPDDLPATIKNSIVGISAFNFFLPALKLYQLSFSDKTIDKRSLFVTVGYYVLHLILVDIPYLSIRLYLWFAFRDNASMFLMKNILSIILTLRGMYPDLITLSGICFSSGRQRTNDKPVAETTNEETALNDQVELAQLHKGEPV